MPLHSGREPTRERPLKTFDVVAGPYVADILDQPRALRATIEGLATTGQLDAVARRLAAGAYRRVVLTGMGGSCHALAPLLLRLVASGVPAVSVETSELVHYQPGLIAPDTLLVIVSQSGRSAEIVRLLEAARPERLDTVAVTNTQDSPLAQEAGVVLLTRAGAEATVSCKTYVAAQAALAVLGERLAGGDPAPVLAGLAGAAAGIEAYLAAGRAHVASLAPRLAGVRSVYYAGRGPSLAAAGVAGLITKEATHRPAEGMSSAAFRHGPFEMLDGAVFLLVFGGPARTRALNEALVADARAAGARAHLAGEESPEPVFRLPAVPEPARPAVELLPVEMITLALAAIDGREAGRFERAAKVTISE